MKNTKKNNIRKVELTMLFFFFFYFIGYATSFAPDEVIWFGKPAKDWSTEALHIGNGYMGASFYGGIEIETFDISEKTFWTGGPSSPNKNIQTIKPGGKYHINKIKDLISSGNFKEADSLCQRYMTGDFRNYGYFSTVGKLMIKLDHSVKNIKDYKRGIDLSEGIGFVSYTIDNTEYKREYYCSYPDRVMVFHFEANKENSLNMEVSHSYTFPVTEIINKQPSGIIARGKIQSGLDYSIVYDIMTKDGKVYFKDNNIVIEKSTSVDIVYTVATEYELKYPLYKGKKPFDLTKKIIENAKNEGYVKLRQKHVEDYSKLYDRVSFKLNSNNLYDNLPTDERVKLLKKGNVDDTKLKVLWFNLSRYLIISASRKGTLPSNLQGVWNCFEHAPWNGNYQSNINLQEMYWSCGPTRLGECEESYIDWIKDLTNHGEVVAKEYYGAKGWVSHSASNIWGNAAPGGEILYGLYPSGAAWHCRHLWEHYLFNGNEKFLKETAYPIMKSAAEFWLDNMIPYQGYLVPGPSVSAEHGIEIDKQGNFVELSTTNGEEIRNKIFTVPTTQEIVMVSDLFRNTISASKVLNIDKAFSEKLAAVLSHFYPLQIGKYGQLQEWVIDVDNPMDHHRHIAHLYGMYPANIISFSKDKELSKAVEKSLRLRGYGKKGPDWPHTGGNWSMIWRMAVWSRLCKGDIAIDIFNTMIKESGYNNMMTNQSGYMMLDATMATSGVFAEMHLQSHDGFINILPSLPSEWPEGSVKGLAARGGYLIDISWKNGDLVKAIIYSKTYKKRPKVLIKGKEDDKNRIIFK